MPPYGLIIPFDVIKEQFVSGLEGEVVKFDDENWTNIKIRVVFLNKCWKDKLIPLKNPSYKKECSYCKFKKICDDDEKSLDKMKELRVL